MKWAIYVLLSLWFIFVLLSLWFISVSYFPSGSCICPTFLMVHKFVLFSKQFMYLSYFPSGSCVCPTFLVVHVFVLLSQWIINLSYFPCGSYICPTFLVVHIYVLLSQWFISVSYFPSSSCIFPNFLGDYILVYLLLFGSSLCPTLWFIFLFFLHCGGYLLKAFLSTKKLFFGQLMCFYNNTAWVTKMRLNCLHISTAGQLCMYGKRISIRKLFLIEFLYLKINIMANF